MSKENNPSVAIVGSGPSGCYTAQALLQQWPAAEFAILDRLPVPYGLIRYGVAPDHQGTKIVTRQFDRLFEKNAVHFFGNVSVGRDVSVDRLLELFDVVILASGISGDRRLRIPGEDLDRVYGSGVVTRLINGHPDEVAVPRFGHRVVVVGHGNVAIDIVRILAKPYAEFGDSDICERFLTESRGTVPARIEVVGRSAPAAAKCDAVAVRELAKLRDVRFELHGADLGDVGAPAQDRSSQGRLDAFRLLADIAAPAAMTISFRFGVTPVRFLGHSSLEGVVLQEVATGAPVTLPVDSAVTAIGFEESRATDLSVSDRQGPGADLGRGRLQERLYCVGWLRRGPRGTIAENRVDARTVASVIAEETSEDGAGRGGVAALRAILDVPWVDFAGWQRIDRSERRAAVNGRVRKKFTSLDDLLTVARGEEWSLEGAER